MPKQSKRGKPTGWKEIKLNIELIAPTLGDLHRLARALMESSVDLSRVLSPQNFGLICLLSSLILDERKAALPIFPVKKVACGKRKKAK